MHALRGLEGRGGDDWQSLERAGLRCSGEGEPRADGMNIHEPESSKRSRGDEETEYMSKLDSSNAGRVSSKVGSAVQSIIASARSGDDARRRKDVAEESLCAERSALGELELFSWFPFEGEERSGFVVCEEFEWREVGVSVARAEGDEQ